MRRVRADLSQWAAASLLAALLRSHEDAARVMSSLIGRLIRQADWDRECAAGKIRHRWRWLKSYTRKKRRFAQQQKSQAELNKNEKR